ncbi:hypothetical protein [Chryseobacterium sp. EO14]|uniref:hypothetical protein n=1 Tax=Chryseobacterium sp. EO14 TaxID=2950551 RepID=UPI00210D6C63|nr:hypothetical protein [Chryseobacterium sp. EO14]MCQ4140945.1 hypothetical protein [Chryseobacterium sp. EO14]
MTTLKKVKKNDLKTISDVLDLPKQGDKIIKKDVITNVSTIKMASYIYTDYGKGHKHRKMSD